MQCCCRRTSHLALTLRPPRQPLELAGGPKAEQLMGAGEAGQLLVRQLDEVVDTGVVGLMRLDRGLGRGDEGCGENCNCGAGDHAEPAQIDLDALRRAANAADER